MSTASISTSTSTSTSASTYKPEIGLRFSVMTADGKRESLLVDASSALIGSGSHCEVRLPPTEAAHEHVELMVMNGVVHLAARQAPPLLDGVPIVSGPWPRGTTLSVGSTMLMVDVVDLTPSRRTRSPFWALAPVPVLAAVATIVATRSAPAADAVIPPAPTLLDPIVMTCPSPPGPTLGSFATERARVGLAKRERSPFSPADGVEAVGILETSAACYRVARMFNEERDMTSIARALRAKLEEEYHVRRVRVEHAYKVGDPFGAKRELQVLMPMMAHRRGVYVDWLGSVDRHATAAIDSRSHRKL